MKTFNDISLAPHVNAMAVLTEENNELRRQLVYLREAVKDHWVWRDDEPNNLHSMGNTMAVLISAGSIRALLAKERREAIEDDVMEITTAYEQGVGKGLRAVGRGEEISNPYVEGTRGHDGWSVGYEEGKDMAHAVEVVK